MGLGRGGKPIHTLPPYLSTSARPSLLQARKAREASAAKPTKAVAPVASAEAKASAAGAAGSGAATPASGTEAPAGASVISSVKGGVKGLPERVSVSLGGREIYQWEQTLDEVNIYVPQPAGVPAKAIGCELEVAHIRLGINLKSPSPQVYFDEDLGGPISVRARASIALSLSLTLPLSFPRSLPALAHSHVLLRSPPCAAG